MKNKITITLTFLVTFIIPAGFVFAQYNDFSSSLNQLRRDYNLQNEINNYNQRLDSGLQEYSQMMSNQNQAWQNQQNNFYQQESLNIQRQQLELQRQALQGSTKSGTLCNGRYWGACSDGKNFVCPSTGDPYCKVSNTCSDGFSLNKNKQCVTRLQACIDDYGSGSVWNGKVTDTGGSICTCDKGFMKPSDGSNSCVAIPITNDQICSYKYGKNWGWDGTTNSAGGSNCGCNSGYNKENGECVLAPIKTNAQVLSSEAGSIVGTPELHNTIEVTAEKKKATVVHEPTIAKHSTTTEVKVSSTTENKVLAEKDNVPVKKLPYQKGVIQKAWEWATGLFHF